MSGTISSMHLWGMESVKPAPDPMGMSSNEAALELVKLRTMFRQQRDHRLSLPGLSDDYKKYLHEYWDPKLEAIGIALGALGRFT